MHGTAFNVNVDFYSGAGTIFAVGRVPGWAVQVLEQIENNILIRRLTLYSGPEPRASPRSSAGNGYRFSASGI